MLITLQNRKLKSKTAGRLVATILKKNGVIVYPTETLYGFGALMSSHEAIRRIVALKKRSDSKPFIFLVKNLDMLSRCGIVTNPMANRLIEHFWPGPLTLILKMKNTTCAVRQSSHPFVEELFEFIDEPLVSTSANLSGADQQAASFDAIRDLFEPHVDLIIQDDIIPQNTRPSTIVDVSSGCVKMVRDGCISKQEIEEIV